jgi:lipopolysaccharide transport system ATP-binding protein
MKPILEVRNLSKKYKIQHINGGYLSFRERIIKGLKFNRQNQEDFWALNDVSFVVNPGESVGIIGRNGAGKSTLLKILSKITPPTKGRILMRGRIASLLEVGTGFHPELTGRENVFFNGSLLGMKKQEIQKNFDAIVDFSGTEKFLDTPLKHYSSGMQLRLAFAVAAFLEPEILVIDEVLAVGDAEFQKKCLGKMEDVAKSGRTVLFVSHNIQALRGLCTRGVLLRNGLLASDDSIDEVIKSYMKDSASKGISVKLLQTNDEYLSFTTIGIIQDEQQTTEVVNGKAVSVEICYEVLKQIGALQIFVDVFDAYENLIFRTFHFEHGSSGGFYSPQLAMPGLYRSRLTIPGETLVEGNYRLVVKAANMYERSIKPEQGIAFDLAVKETGKFSRKLYQGGKGMITPAVTWNTERVG